MLTKNQAAGQVAHTYIEEQAKRLRRERVAKARGTVVAVLAGLFVLAAILDSVGVF